jgi:hypothetical protein
MNYIHIYIYKFVNYLKIYFKNLLAIGYTFYFIFQYLQQKLLQRLWVSECDVI